MREHTFTVSRENTSEKDRDDYRTSLINMLSQTEFGFSPKSFRLNLTQGQSITFRDGGDAEVQYIPLVNIEQPQTHRAIFSIRTSLNDQLEGVSDCIKGYSESLGYFVTPDLASGLCF